ncbi:hypothetical protein D3C72_2057290 [compost metagenome]
MTTINTVNSTGVLKAIKDGAVHVSVTPVKPGGLISWIESKPNSQNSSHEYTQIIKSICVEVKY